MARPRYQDMGKEKKVGTSLTFTPEFVQALDAVRGAKSQAVFVEEWMRQNPAISTKLTEMGDAGFQPSISRNEQLVHLLLTYYRPDFAASNPMFPVLKVARDIIMRNLGTEEEIVQEIVSAMRMLWLCADYKQSNLIITQDDLPLALKEYAEYYYRAIFLEYCEGERALLRSRFKTLVLGCDAVYEHIKREWRERETRETSLSD